MLSAEIATRTRFTNADIGTDRITCNSLDPGTVNTKMLLAEWMGSLPTCGIDVEDALDERIVDLYERRRERFLGCLFQLKECQ